MIVGLWDRLADDCKCKVIEMVQANLPAHETESGCPKRADD